MKGMIDSTSMRMLLLCLLLAWGSACQTPRLEDEGAPSQPQRHVKRAEARRENLRSMTGNSARRIYSGLETHPKKEKFE